MTLFRNLCLAALFFIFIGRGAIGEAGAQTPPLDSYYPTFCKQNSTSPVAATCIPAPPPTAPWIASFGLPISGQGSTPEAARDNAIAASNAYIASLGPVSSYYDRYRVHPDFPNCSVAKTDNVFWYSPDTTRIRYYTRCEIQRIDIRYDPPVVMFNEYVNGNQDTQCPVNWQPHGTVFDSDPNLSHKSFPAICYRSDTAPKEMGDCPTCAGNPIGVAIGNKYQRETDYSGTGNNPLQLTRYYNSAGAFSAINIGKNWRITYDRRVDFDGRTSAWVTRGDGKIHSYRFNGTAWVTDGDIASRLSSTAAGWQLIDERNDTVEAFDLSGRLVSITARSGEATQLAYSNASTPATVAPAPGYLITVTDSFGRSLQLSYSSSGRLASVSLPDSATVQYGYDANGNLESATYPDGKTRYYLYNETGYSSTPASTAALTGIIDENNTRFATFQYDVNGRAISTEHAGGVYKFTVGSSNPYQVTDPLGTVRTTTMSVIQGANRPVSATQPCSVPGCSGTVGRDTTYDANANVTSRTDFNGNKTCYAFDMARNLETARVEGLPNSAVCTTQLAASTHTPPARKISTSWHPTFRLPYTITEPTTAGNKVTTYLHDANGNVLSKSVAVGGNTRTWTWSGYDAYGRPGSVDGPRSDVSDSTTYEYYPNTAGQNSVIAHSRGMLKKVTNAAGHATEITAYNAHGQPLSMTDANGLVTSMTYDARQRIKTRNVGGETTSYDYDNAGQLIKVTMPDSSVINYGYDNAHRLWKITDGADINSGNRIEYVLDNMGNRVNEFAYDPSSALARKSKREIDSLDRLWKTYSGADTGSFGYATENTYDNNGNLVIAKDPLNRSITNSYDALNRMTGVSVPAQVVTDPAHVTTYEYDVQDNLKKVIEPATPHPSGSGTWRRDTTYNYNGFNEVETQISKDTGTTTFTYDAAGNLKTKTDARGICATYAYDNLNRVISIGYAGTCNATTPTETVAYVYDTCTNGKGRLCSLTDKTGSTTYTYDIKGRVTSKTQTVDTLSQTVSYQYNAVGQLEFVTLPIYMDKIGYTYANNRVRSVTYSAYGSGTTTVIAGCIEHEPFGPASDWKWGTTDCGSTTNPHIRLFDLDGRISQIASGAGLGSNKFSYDSAARLNSIEALTALDGASVPAKSFTYGYVDPFDRLTSQTPGAGNTAQTIGYGYDAIGNRRTLNTSSAPPGLVNDSLTITYGADNRPTQWSSTITGTTLLKINALGQRVKKESAITGVTRFVYDEAGRLLAEYDNTGVPLFEYIWLGDLPIATVRNGVIHYVHSDNLGTPRQITTTTGNTVWKWDNADPFGNNAANELPNGGNIPFRYNLRFPGQYADQETGTSYNYFRDYSPAEGRYVQSDPIGLKGGINTYAYVNGSPVSKIDPTGEFGIAGAVGSAGFEIAIQLAMNGFEWGCIDWEDVAAAGFTGFFVPKALTELGRARKAFGASTTYQTQVVNARSASSKAKARSKLSRANGELGGAIGNIGYSSGAKTIAKEILPPGSKCKKQENTCESNPEPIQMSDVFAP